MKNVILCGINARYTHSNLALLCLKHAVEPNDHIQLIEMSINDRIPSIVEHIARSMPDAVGFSCYIWNIEFVVKVASTLKKVLPNSFIFFGGPEVSHDSIDMMKHHNFIDMIICGSGELPFRHFMESFQRGESILDTPSATIRDGDRIISTQDTLHLDMDTLPFLYNDLESYKHKIIYYETSRGCPYRCAYCMSANEKIRYLSLDRVQDELEFFIKANVRQVKLVDRTFNYPLERAYAIVEMLINLSEKYPKSQTNFHFEVSACLLDDKIIDLLSQAPKNLIQLEIGIQTTHPETLEAINRKHDVAKLFRNTKALCDMDNIHVHVDLIAGLPHESYAIFAKSFNDTYTLGAEQLQLGFLKVLNGSPMKEMADKYTIKYTDYAPYEVLSTHVISYQELSMLHRIEHVVDTLYNTGHFKKTLEHFIPYFPSPFAFYEKLALYLDQHDFFIRPHKKSTLFEKVYGFAQEIQDIKIDIIKEALTYDWLRLEKPRNWPKGLELPQTEKDKQQIRNFYKDKDRIDKYLPAYQNLSGSDISKRCAIVYFDHLFTQPTAVLFDYGKSRDHERFAQIIDK